VIDRYDRNENERKQQVAIEKFNRNF